MNNDDKMFDMLEKIYIELTDFKKETNAQFDQVNNKIGHMDNRINQMDAKIDQMDNRINQIDYKIDNEVITRLDRLDSNQESINQYILNCDDAFKKSEEAYDVIQKFREAFAE